MRNHDSLVIGRRLRRRLRISLSLGLGLLLLGCSAFPRVAILHDPLTEEEHVQLGIAYEEQGQWNRALAEYQDALKKNRRYLPALVNQGNVYTQMEQYPQAEKYYRKVLKLDPDHPMANNNLAWIKILQKTDLGDAEGFIKKAITADPDRRAVYLDTLAYLYLQMERFDEALEALEEAEVHLPAGDDSLKAHLTHTRDLITRGMQSGSGGGSSQPRRVDRPEEVP